MLLFIICRVKNAVRLVEQPLKLAILYKHSNEASGKKSKRKHIFTKLAKTLDLISIHFAMIVHRASSTKDKQMYLEKRNL